MRRVVDANLHSYIEQATQTYSRLFGKTPTFVTYYSQDTSQSYADVNLGGAIQLVGQESPLRFQKINDFPLYGMSDADVSSSYDELQGIVSAGVHGETYALPGTIEPMENDRFVIDYLETKLVFRAISCNPDRLEGKSYFKIEWALDPVEIGTIERQVVESFDFELSTIGTGDNPLIESDLAILLREMEVLVEFHRASYWKAFYDRSSGALLCRTGFDRPLHDRGVDLIVANKSLLGSNGYMKGRTVVPVDYSDRGSYDDMVYPLTLYWQAERGKWDPAVQTLNSVMLAPSSPIRQSNPFFAEFAVDGYIEALTAPSASYQIGGPDFVAKTTAKDYADDVPIRALARRCLQEDGMGTDTRVALRAFNLALNDSSLVLNRADQYWLMPIVLMRAKRFRDQARANN
jgi:hypothetical protein